MCRYLRLLIACSALAGCTEIVYDQDTHWTDDRDIPAIGDGKIIITDSGEDTLTWLDLDSLEPVFTEPVGRVAPEREGPHHGAVMTDGSAYFIGISNYVPGSGSGPHGSHGTGSVPGLMLKYDSNTHVLVGEVRVDRSPGDVRMAPDGSVVLQSHFDLLTIQEALDAGGGYDDMVAPLAVVDPVTMALEEMVPVCPAPHGIAPSADSSEVYLACWASDELGIVKLDGSFEVERYPVGPGTFNPTAPRYEPYGATVSPADGAVWISDLRTGDLRVFDPSTRTWDEDRGPVITGGSPFFTSFTSDGAFLIVPVQQTNTVVKVDAATGQVVATLPLDQADCLNPHATLVLPGDDRAVLVCEGDHINPGSVAAMTLDPFEVTAFHTVGVYPDDAILLRKP